MKNETIKQYQLGITSRNTDWESIKISKSGDAAKEARKYYHDDLEIYESFFLLLLDQGMNTIGYVKISQGGIAGTIVDTKIVVNYVVETLSQNIILVHNHPSGTLQPSESDRVVTRKLIQALGWFDSKVKDHIILTKDSHYSFADNGECGL